MSAARGHDCDWLSTERGAVTTLVALSRAITAKGDHNQGRLSISKALSAAVEDGLTLWSGGEDWVSRPSDLAGLKPRNQDDLLTI